MLNFLLGPFLSFLPIVVLAGIALIVAVRYSGVSGGIVSSLPSYRNLARATIIFYIIHASILTAGQYYVWTSDPSQTFLNTPISSTLPIPIVQSIPWFHTSPLGYFALYSFVRFWIQPILSIAGGFIFLYFLKTLSRYRERFFDEGDIALGFVASLVVGWPSIIVFLLTTFMSVVVISLIRLVKYREPYTTLGWPFVFGMILGVAAAYTSIIEMIGLGVLRI